jgi:hypothetical protein
MPSPRCPNPWPLGGSAAASLGFGTLKSSASSSAPFGFRPVTNATDWTSPCSAVAINNGGGGGSGSVGGGGGSTGACNIVLLLPRLA